MFLDQYNVDFFSSRTKIKGLPQLKPPKKAESQYPLQYCAVAGDLSLFVELHYNQQWRKNLFPGENRTKKEKNTTDVK